MNIIVKQERAKVEAYREKDHKHYQVITFGLSQNKFNFFGKESVDELHTHYKEQMDTIQEEAKKQIKDIEARVRHSSEQFDLKVYKSY